MNKRGARKPLFVKELNVQNSVPVLRSIALFLIAALSEIGGAYLVWQWVRVGRSVGFAALGTVALLGYALLQTTQPFNFGRAFAGYGGIFIAAALLWGWWVDGHLPDRWDWVGVAACMSGVAIILWAPRS